MDRSLRGRHLIVRGVGSDISGRTRLPIPTTSRRWRADRPSPSDPDRARCTCPCRLRCAASAPGCHSDPSSHSAQGAESHLRLRKLDHNAHRHGSLVRVDLDRVGEGHRVVEGHGLTHDGGRRCRGRASMMSARRMNGAGLRFGGLAPVPCMGPLGAPAHGPGPAGPGVPAIGAAASGTTDGGRPRSWRERPQASRWGRSSPRLPRLIAGITAPSMMPTAAGSGTGPSTSAGRRRIELTGAVFRGLPLGGEPRPIVRSFASLQHDPVKESSAARRTTVAAAFVWKCVMHTRALDSGLGG